MSAWYTRFCSIGPACPCLCQLTAFATHDVNKLEEMDSQCIPHHEIQMYYQSTDKAHAEALQALIVYQLAAAFASMAFSWQMSCARSCRQIRRVHRDQCAEEICRLHGPVRIMVTSQQHYEIWEYYLSTKRAHAQVLQNLLE